jgi:hypothetical protein
MNMYISICTNPLRLIFNKCANFYAEELCNQNIDPWSINEVFENLQTCFSSLCTLTIKEFQKPAKLIDSLS